MPDSEIIGLVEDTTPDETDVVYMQNATGTVDKRVPWSGLLSGAVRITERPRSPLQATYGGSFTGPNVVAAAAGGAAVDLPPTACSTITSAMVLPAGTVLTGIPDKTVFTAGAGVTPDVFTAGADVTIRGVTIDGNKAGRTSGTGGYGIKGGAAAHRVKVTNCVIKNTYHCGVLGSVCDDWDVIDNLFTACGTTETAAAFTGDAVQAKGHRWRINRNVMVDNIGSGVGFGGSAWGTMDYCEIKDNVITNSGRFGIATGSYARWLMIDGNVIDTCGDNLIDTGTAIHLSIINNTCYNAGPSGAGAASNSDGIDLDLYSLPSPPQDLDILIANNRVDNCGRYGIIVGLTAVAGVGRSGLTVVGNKVSRTRLQGIVAVNAHHSTISNNTVKDASTVGASFFGSIGLEGHSRYNVVSGNVCWEDRAVGARWATGYADTQDPASNVDYTTVIGNDFSGCAVGMSTIRTNDLRSTNRIP